MRRDPVLQYKYISKVYRYISNLHLHKYNNENGVNKKIRGNYIYKDKYN